MGDRVTCILTLSGEIRAETIASLADHIDRCNPETFDEPSITTKLIAGEAHFQFHEVNNGEMETQLSDAIKSLGLSYSWCWEEGGGFGAGCDLHDAATGETASYPMSSWDFCVYGADLENPERMEAARRWHRFHQHMPPLVVVNPQAIDPRLTTPAPVKSQTRFTRFLIAECAETGEGDTRETVRAAALSDEERKDASTFWTVYGVSPEGPSTAIGDFKTEETARDIAEAIAYGRPVDLDASAA